MKLKQSSAADVIVVGAGLGGLTAAIWLASTGCREKKEDAKKVEGEAAKTETTAAETAVAKVAEELDAATKDKMNVVLAKADALDGETDHICSKCAGCALAMSGSADHAAKWGDYTMHFCSDDCKTGFEKDMVASVLALKIPEVKVPAVPAP